MKKKICIVVANYYPDISKQLLTGSLKVLKKNNLNNIKIIYVPGIFEIPYIISKNISKFDAFISLGCVIKGETLHFELITESTTNALMQLSIIKKKPICHGIIACFNKKQALERSNIHKKDKGGETAKALLKVFEI
tara:strand:- start:574 stop:981 length:408 start_codon:yes stop_codon:yes gene_type:complete